MKIFLTQMLKIYEEPYIQEIKEGWIQDKGIQLFIKREDVIHPYVSGNKWRKLKYNLEEAQQLGHSKLLTFGGAFSNHIYATAAAAKEAGLESVGVIRGDELAKKPLNKTLTFAKGQGMHLHFVSRENYRQKTSAVFLKELKAQFGDFFLIPEGGTNVLALQGTAEILNTTTSNFNYIATSSGTGGTAAGIIAASLPQQEVIAFSALKGEFLNDDIAELLRLNKTPKSNWRVETGYHCGGYAKMPDYLMEFIASFEVQHRIPLDPVYTGKMIYGIYDLIKKGFFKPDAQILAIHTGGLQGRKES